MKTPFALLTLLVVSTAVFAAPPGPGPHERGARMQQELGLSDEQMREMREIRERGGSREEMRAVMTEEQRAKAGQLSAQRREHMRETLELSDEQVAEIDAIRESGGGPEQLRAVLTDEQRAKFDEMRRSHQGKGPRGKGAAQE